MDELIRQIETVYAAMRAATAEVDAKIEVLKAVQRSLEVQRADLAAPYAWKLETLQQALREAVVQAGLTQVKGQSFTLSVREQVKWDDAGLRAYAVEVPSVMQFRQVEHTTMWRWKK